MSLYTDRGFVLGFGCTYTQREVYVRVWMGLYRDRDFVLGFGCTYTQREVCVLDGVIQGGGSAIKDSMV